MNSSSDTQRFSAACFPNPEQELLLKASLYEGEEALSAWRDWKSRIDIERIDHGSFRLLALLYDNLRKLKVQDPLLERIKSVYRYTWTKNQLSIRRSLEIIRRLEDQGIPTLLLKGGALTLFNYKDHGLRYMDDFDFMVPFDKAPAAIASLIRWGFDPALKEKTEFISYTHSTNFEGHGIGLDLHWHLLNKSLKDQDDLPFWKAAIPVEREGVKTAVLHPSDQLLQICVHGVRWSPTPPIRWVADAWVLLKTQGDQVDWERLVDQARRLRLTIQVQETLEYLVRRLGAPVPLSFLQKLEAAPKEKWEKKEYRARIAPHPWLDEIPLLWTRYPRSLESGTYRLKAIGFIKFLKNYLGFESEWEMPAFLLRRFIQRTKKNFSEA